MEAEMAMQCIIPDFGLKIKLFDRNSAQNCSEYFEKCLIFGEESDFRALNTIFSVTEVLKLMKIMVSMIV